MRASRWARAALGSKLPPVLGSWWELPLGRASPSGLNLALGLASSSGLVLPPQSEPSLHPPGTTTGTPPAQHQQPNRKKSADVHTPSRGRIIRKFSLGEAAHRQHPWSPPRHRPNLDPAGSRGRVNPLRLRIQNVTELQRPPHIAKRQFFQVNSSPPVGAGGAPPAPQFGKPHTLIRCQRLWRHPDYVQLEYHLHFPPECNRNNCFCYNAPNQGFWAGLPLYQNPRIFG